MTQPNFPPPPAGVPLVVAPPRPRTSALAVVTMVVLGVIGVGVVVLLVINASPIPVVVSALAAAITFPLLIALCFWLDRYEPEPGRYRLAALAWGGTAAVLIGAGLSYLLAYLVDASEVVAAVVWAPLTEEFGKGLFLILLVLLRRGQLHGPLDGAIYAALVGIGFSFVEDTLYYSVGLLTGGPESLIALVVLRGVLGAFSHSVYGALFGIGIGIAVQSRTPAVRVLAPLAGFVAAVLMHAIWNASITFYDQLGFLAAYVLAMLPLLGVLVALGVWARDREGRMIRGALADCARLGFVAFDEIDLAASLPARLRARRYARQIGGRPTAQLMTAFQQTLVEMAFLHAQVSRGHSPPDAGPRMAALIARAAALRPYLVRPPLMS